MVKQSTHSWVIAGDVVIAFTTAGAMPDEPWAAMCHELSTKPVIGFLGTSIGVVEVSSIQRRLGIDAAKKRGLPSAIVTEEKMVRGLATAASWLGAKIKAFSWNEAREAIRFLGVPAHKEDLVYNALMKLRASAGK